MEKTNLISEILFPGKSVQIEVVNQKGYKLVTKTTVHKLDDTQLTLNLPNMGDFFNRVLPNTEIIIVCKQQADPEEHVFITQYVKIAGLETPVVVLNIPTRYKKGRQSPRFEVAVPFSFFIGEQEIKEGIVINLSIIGLLAAIQPTDALKAGHELVFKLFLPTTPAPLLLTGTINRIVKGEKAHRIAVHFPEIGPELRQQISDYLFKATQQKQQLKSTLTQMD